MGNLVQTIIVVFVAQMLMASWPKLSARIGPYAVRATTLIGPNWARILGGFVVGVAVTLSLGAIGGALPSIDWGKLIPNVPSIVTPAGPRRILIAYESKGADEQFMGELVTLRKDADAGYLKSKSHVLDILDLDAKGPDGQPSTRVVEFKANFADLKPPVLMVIAPPSKVLSVEAVPESVKATELIEKVKAKE